MVNCKGIHEAVLACLFALPCAACGDPGIHINQSGWPVVRVRFRTETCPIRIYDAQLCVINIVTGFGNVWKFAGRMLDWDTCLPMVTKRILS
jgi:hypothetical protein